MSCKLSDKCDNVFACNILRPEVELLGCSFYKPKKPMTNEEWFCGLSTEEKAEVLFDIWYDGKVLAWDKSKPFYFNRFVTWLKEVHKGEM